MPCAAGSGDDGVQRRGGKGGGQRGGWGGQWERAKLAYREAISAVIKGTKRLSAYCKKVGFKLRMTIV